ncbi:MAG: HD domain-containing phosphohydrolase [Gemmataceae bacterium]|nr:HD domain-containing protein [Gemmata sp.]MDW8196002.1 HD domain-containing phosphohydrolase [Gemmataceae bacterium]
MSDTRKLLERITAFRRRLEATPQLIPEAVPIDCTLNLPAEVEAFRQSLRSFVGSSALVDEGPLPTVLTDRARQLLGRAKELLHRQRSLALDPHFSGQAAPDSSDVLVQHHRETVALLESVVRQAQVFSDSPSEQVRWCEGMATTLAVVQARQEVQERALTQRKIVSDRIDRLAHFFTAIHTNMPATLQSVAQLAEELLEDARQGQPLRFAEVDITSTQAHPNATVFPAPARFIAAHCLNTAQVVARIVHHDYEWAARPLLPVFTALVMDCGMLAVNVAVLAKTEPLATDERRLLEAHPKYGAELLLWRFPNIAGPLAAGVASHHERADGTGYPNGLRQADIPSLGRLLRVCDVYTALRENRPHRAALDSRAALTEVLLFAERGDIDRDFAEYLLHLTFYPIGTIVELLDGRVGRVVANPVRRLDPRSPSRPVVAVLTDTEGRLLPHPEHLDLSSTERGGILRGLSAERSRELLGSRYPDWV